MSNTAIALAADLFKLQQLVESSDELTPEMIADTLEGLEGALGDKLDATYVFVRNLEGQAKTCDEEAKRLADRKRSFENRANSTSLTAYWPQIRTHLKRRITHSPRVKVWPVW